MDDFHHVNQSNDSFSEKTSTLIQTLDDKEINFESMPSVDESDQVIWLSADVRDDGPEYRHQQFTHTKTMFECFHSLFGLRKFRPNQQEAIHCALERRFHLFVLMPTGIL